jgi:multiple RNA-binding domain-containing protein 1
LQGKVDQNTQLRKDPKEELTKTVNPLRAELERKKKLLQDIYGEEADSEASQLRAFINASKSTSQTKIWENDAENTIEIEEKVRKGKSKARKVDSDVQRIVEEDQKVMKSQSDGNMESDDDLYEDYKGPNSTDKLQSESDLEEKRQDHQPIGDEFKDSSQPSSRITPELNADLILETGRLFVRNLSYACTEDDLRQLFEPYGALTEVHLSISRDTKKPKGFAYILFMFPEHALRAYSELDGIILHGRILHILPAQEKPEARIITTEGQGSSYQAKKVQEQKSTAQKDYNWNSLFMRSDTVLDAIAAKLGVAKSSIMDVQSENLATRLAIAETNLIHETKAYLESEGVVLDAFIASYERSNTVILVKNLPFDTEAAELRHIFEKFGTLGRVVLPPTKAVALVEFFEPSEAKTAFRTLAYSKFKNVPLFLEMAPIKALTPSKTGKVEQKSERVQVKNIVGEAERRSTDHDEPETTSSSNTLYVKNLNFSTPSDTLKTVFSAMGPIRYARVATKKNGDKTLSLGFGFVEFERKESLNRALDELQGHIVDGHALLLMKSATRNDGKDQSSARRKRASDVNDEENSQNTKLVVRNVPFEANEKEVRELFKTFAQLKRVRLPRRYDGRHRGFGFVDFLTHQEAVNARAALAHTHLYGRHLVIEWAKPQAEDTAEGEGAGQDVERRVEELREKTKKRMNIGGKTGTTKRRLCMKADQEDMMIAISDSGDE